MINFLSLHLKLECPLILTSHKHKNTSRADIYWCLFNFLLLKFSKLGSLNFRNLNTYRQSVFLIEINLKYSLCNQNYIFEFIERRFDHLKLETTIEDFYETRKFWSWRPYLRDRFNTLSLIIFGWGIVSIVFSGGLSK